MPDQAEALRVRVRANESSDFSSENGMARVIAVASGKGGVGKSNFSVNFAMALQKAGKTVVVIDTDVGFADVELLLGVRAKHSLMDILEGASMGDVLEHSGVGLPFISAGSGFTDIHSLSVDAVHRLLSELNRLQDQFDYVVIDCGAGLGGNLVELLRAADDLVIVATPEPTAIADAYSLLKQLVSKDKLSTVRVVINRAATFVEAKLAADKLVSVCRRFLDIAPSPLGYILEDETVGQAVMRQEPFLTAFPNSQGARCMIQLADNYLRSEVALPRRGWNAFLHRLTSRLRRESKGWNSSHPA